MNLSSIPVIVLSAGENSRFFPLNTDTHKGALRLCGQSLILRMLYGLAGVGFKKIYIVVSPKDYNNQGLTAELQNHHLNIEVEFILQGQATGMGGALLLAKDKIRDKTFAVVFPYSIEAGKVFIKMTRVKQTNGVLALTKTNKPWLYGIASIRGQRVISITEKPKKTEGSLNLKLQGVYLLSSNFMPYLENTPIKDYSFESALHYFVKKYPVSFIRLNQPLLTLKYPWHLFDFKNQLLKNLDKRIENTISIDKNITIKRSYIGPHCFVGKNAIIEDSIIEEGTKISAGIHIKNSIIFKSCKIHSSIKDSIIGANVSIGKGVIVLTKGEKSSNKIITQVKGKPVNTDLKNFGTVVGNNTVIQKNVFVDAGIFIGANVMVPKEQRIRKHIPHN